MSVGPRANSQGQRKKAMLNSEPVNAYKRTKVQGRGYETRESRTGIRPRIGT
jgi:hypothetical protein